jgi:anti-sigma regulatory factor (Ser/Thr protein kinase)
MPQKMRAESATTRIEPVVRQELRRALEARSGGGTAAADGQLALEEEASLIAAASGAEPVATEVTIIMALKHRKGASKRGNLLSDAAISAALALGHTA